MTVSEYTLNASRINESFEFTETKWVVSLVNTIDQGTGKWLGHTVIVVEGIRDNGNLFIGEYDIQAAALKKSSLGSIGNTEGVICDIRCNPDSFDEPKINRAAKFEGAFRDYRHKDFSAKSWFTTANAAINMIQTIEAEALSLSTEINEAHNEMREADLPLYQTAGASRYSIFGGNGGHNCVTWAEEKLKIAGINHSSVIDPKKAIPAVHVMSCVVS